MPKARAGDNAATRPRFGRKRRENDSHNKLVMISHPHISSPSLRDKANVSHNCPVRGLQGAAALLVPLKTSETNLQSLLPWQI